MSRSLHRFRGRALRADSAEEAATAPSGAHARSRPARWSVVTIRRALHCEASGAHPRGASFRSTGSMLVGFGGARVTRVRSSPGGPLDRLSLVRKILAMNGPLQAYASLFDESGKFARFVGNAWRRALETAVIHGESIHARRPVRRRLPVCWLETPRVSTTLFNVVVRRAARSGC